MKKLSILLASLLLVSGLAACGNKTTPSSTGDASTPVSESTASAVSTPVDEKPAAIAERGAWNENVFSNEFFGLTFTTPEGWTAMTDEQIAAAMAIGVEALGEAGGAFTEEALAQTSLYDMMAVDATTGDNVMVIYENLAVNPLGNLISAEAYLNIVRAQMEKMQGTTYEFGDITEMEIGGETFFVISVSSTQQGVAVNQSLCARKVDGYVISIVATSMSESTADEILGYFS